MSFEYTESEIIKLGSVVFSFVCSLHRLFTPEMTKLCWLIITIQWSMWYGFIDISYKHFCMMIIYRYSLEEHRLQQYQKIRFVFLWLFSFQHFTDDDIGKSCELIVDSFLLQFKSSIWATSECRELVPGHAFLSLY